MLEYHRVWAEINLDNIASNMRQIKKITSENTKVMAVVKADAYGHGAVSISKTALFNGASELGVATSDEGLILRQNNIHVPILIFGYTPEPKLSEVILNNLALTVFSFDIAKSVSDAAVKLNRNVDIHIKIDTGMSRLGFFPTEKTIDDITKILEMPNLNVVGIYSHFAEADGKDKDYTYEQYDKFRYVLNQLESKNINIPNIHISNSAATLDIREFDFNMVRCGIILYGLAPSTQVNFNSLELKPAMSLKSRISYLKEIDKNVSVGYGRTYFTNKKTKVATIPVGYADGFPRNMSNVGRVLVRGQYASVIGNVCMDQLMIDVTDIEGVSSGDEVVLFGRQGSNLITIDELAEIQNTINYEVVCSIGKRVPRVYMKNNSLVKTIYAN